MALDISGGGIRDTGPTSILYSKPIQSNLEDDWRTMAAKSLELLSRIPIVYPGSPSFLNGWPFFGIPSISVCRMGVFLLCFRAKDAIESREILGKTRKSAAQMRTKKEKV